MGITVRKARSVAGWLICLMAAGMFLFMIGLITIGSFYSVPMYVVVPAAMLLPALAMGFAFHHIAMRWLIWAYSHVADVQELTSALQLTGFGYYSSHSLRKKYPVEHAAIMQRFRDYAFVNDEMVMKETTVLYRRPYNSFGFLFYLFVFFIGILMLITSEQTSTNWHMLIIIFLPLAFVAGRKYRRLSDRSVQIMLNDEGMQVQGVFVAWSTLTKYQVIQQREPVLSYETAGESTSINISDLNIGPERLHHLIFVYLQRYKTRK